MLFGITGGSAIHDDFVAGFQREFGHAAFGQLSDAAPFAAPARSLTVLVRDFETNEGVRVAQIELDDLAFHRHNLVLDVRAGERMMSVRSGAGQKGCDDKQDNKSEL